MKNKFPTYYYLILVLVFLLMVLFWVLIVKPNRVTNYSGNTSAIIDAEYWEQDYLPETIGEIIPIDTTKIEIDTINNRKIISNVVNIALKQQNASIAKFAFDFKAVYTSDDYKIVYIDSTINRVQIQLPEKERIQFKTEIKAKLKDYKLLVWDETLFAVSKTFNDPFLADKKASWYIKDINIENAWKTTTGNKNIVIAVIDNGFDLNHPELKNKAIKPYNVITKNKDVAPSQVNHGTHVASTIVSKGNNNEGIVGICPDCSFMPIKVEDANGQMSNSYIIDAILYAIKNKADVINLSLGMQIPLGISIPLEEQKKLIQSTAKDEEEFWNDLFNYANEQNIICILAAGNSNVYTGIDPFQRSKNTIKVGAIDQNNTKATFSNFGDFTTIYAPGTNIIGAKPGNDYEFLQGTSMAAPIISGVIGLLKSKNKNCTIKDVFTFLNKNNIQKNQLNKIYINTL
jgi:subtilisin family serine protease